MECPICHCFAPDDPDTGYHADDICPSCGTEGWTLGADGTVFNEQDDPEEGYEAVR